MSSFLIQTAVLSKTSKSSKSPAPAESCSIAEKAPNVKTASDAAVSIVESVDAAGNSSCDLTKTESSKCLKKTQHHKNNHDAKILQGSASFCSSAHLPVAPKVEYTETAKEIIDNARRLHIYRWCDKKQAPKAVVVAVHGTTQHAGSFAVLAEHLTKKGFVFIALDLRGHGERYYKAFAGQPNHRVDYDKSADDLGLLLKKVKNTYPGLPLFCIGESVGATVAMYTSSRYQGIADGVILCSPGSRPRVFNPLMVLPDFAKGITHLDDQMDVSRYIDHYSSDDKRVSDEMIADPLSRIKLTSKEILRTAFFIRTGPKAAFKVDPAASFLVIQGEKDGIVSTDSTRQIFKNLATEHKQLVEFKDAGHVLLGTSYLKPSVVESVSNWLLDQTRSKVIGLHNSSKPTDASAQ